MPVIGSTFTLEHEQADGSRWCREVHTVTGGSTVEFYYLGAAGTNNQAVMTGRVASVNDMLLDQEAAENIDRDGALTSAHLTGAQMIARFREAVREATRERACYLAWWLLRRIAAGHLTDANARNAFGMTTTQWSTFKTNTLTPRSNAYAAIIAAGGV